MSRAVLQHDMEQHFDQCILCWMCKVIFTVDEALAKCVTIQMKATD